MNDDKKKFSVVPVDPATHAALIALANKEGMAPNEFLGHLADTHFVNWEPPEEKDTDLWLFWRQIKMEIRHRIRQKVYKTAAMYLEDQTDEMADELAGQCEKAGLDYAEVVSKVDNDPFSSLIAFSRNGAKSGECIRWLSETLAQRGEMPAKIIFTVGRQRGYTQSLVNRAKRAINNDKSSPSIKSIRRSHGWNWTIEEQQQQQHDPI